MITVAPKINAGLAHETARSPESTKTQGLAGLVEMLFQGNVGLVEAPCPANQTIIDSSNGISAFSELLAEKITPKNEKTKEIATIMPLPAPNDELLVDLATDGCKTPQDFGIGQEVSQIVKTLVHQHKEPVGEELQNLPLGQQLKAILPTLKSVPMPVNNDLSPVTPEIAPEISAPDTQNMPIVAGETQFSASESVVTAKQNTAPVSEQPASESPLIDRPQLLNYLHDIKQAADIDSNTSADGKMKQGTFILDRSQSENIKAPADMTLDSPKDPVSRDVHKPALHTAFNNNVSPDSSTSNTVIKIKEGDTQFIKDIKPLGDFQVSGSFDESGTIVANNYSENLDPAAPVIESKQEMGASTVIAKQITESVQSAVITDDKQITIRLNPRQLGEIRITFKSEQDHVTGIIEVSRPELKHQIQSMLPGLVNDIQNSGVEVRKMTVADDLLQQQFTGGEQAPSGRQGEQADNSPHIVQQKQISSQDALVSQYSGSPQSSYLRFTDNSLNILA